jgi:hypothetical protein
MKNLNKISLILILLVAIATRFYNYQEIPYTHDEFSALFRTNFDSFPELIEKGVKGDGHPAGIQVFLYYYTKLFGKSEGIVKLPFMLFGIASVALIFLIARFWYNDTVGLLSASFLASIQYAIVYSQIARPYISGLFFSLLMVYFWSKLIKQPYKRFYLNSLMFVLSAALCAYNHHFSLLFAFIVGISGLFLVRREFLLRYCLSGVLIFVLYIPHLNIFFTQLSIGGVEGWLGKPTNDFILKYIAYLFHFSSFWLVAIALGLFFTLRRFKADNEHFKRLLLFSIWFFLPFLIGFFYSKYVNSVIQFSVLIFSFPFIYFVLFGHLKEYSPRVNLLIVLSVLMVNTTTLIVNRDHYNLFYNSRFEKILTDHDRIQKEYPKTISVLHSHPTISQYYIDKMGLDTNFVWFSSFEEISDFKRFVKEASNNYDFFFFGCNSTNNAHSVPVIQEFFPSIIQQNNYAAGNTYLFSKSKTEEVGLKSLLDFESLDTEHWTKLDSTRRVDSVSFSGSHSYAYSSDNEWGPTYTRRLMELIEHENNFIDILVKIKPLSSIDEVILVASLESGGESFYWRGTPVNQFYIDSIPSDDWFTAIQTIKLSDVNLNHRNILLRVYIWNKSKSTFLFDDLKVIVREGNPIVYGMREKLYR